MHVHRECVIFQKILTMLPSPWGFRPHNCTLLSQKYELQKRSSSASGGVTSGVGQGWGPAHDAGSPFPALTRREKERKIVSL